MLSINQRRIEELIKIKISMLLVKGLKDPRLDNFITILGVRLASDGRSARVIYSVIGTDEQKKEVMAGLQSARGYIQMRLAKEMKIKYIPHLIFELDDKTEESVNLVEKINRLSDEAKEVE